MRKLFPTGTRRLAAALLMSGAVAGGAAESVRQAASDSVRLNNARFWRTDSTTLVEGTIGVLLTPRGDSVPAPTVELVVRDQAGNVLHQESWQQDVSDELARIAKRPGGAEVSSSYAVALQKGAYSVIVRAKSGTSADSVVVPVSSFAARPVISDVLLSPQIRVLGQNEQAGAGELQRSVYAITRAPVVKLTPSQAALWYYLEAYAPEGAAPDTTRVDFAVTSTDGARTFLRSSRAFAVAAPGRPDVGKLDMTGLPPGDYNLVVTARAGGREERRETRFAMGTMQEDPTPVAAAASGQSRFEIAEGQMLERYFAPGVMKDSAVTALVDALTLAPIGEAVPKELVKMSAEAQRRYLARYWARLDQTPGTPENELFEEYQQRVSYANRNFSERGRPGVYTDRGRVYLKYGAPDDRMNRPMTRKGAVDVWKYTRSRQLKFVFLDESGFDHFNLIMSTDPNERTQLNWADRVGDQELIRQIQDF